jgi:hypothetical protein
MADDLQDIDFVQYIDFVRGNPNYFLVRRTPDHLLGIHIDGLSHQEEWGRWSDGNVVRLKLKLKENIMGRNLQVEIPDIKVFGSQRVQPVVNGQKLPEILLRSSGEKLRFYVDGSVSKAGTIDIMLNLPDAKSPLEMGYSEDARMLAIGFNAVNIMPED